MNPLAVIVADDSPAFRRMLVRSLALLGHHGVEAPTLDRFEAVIADRVPDVVLLDWSFAGDNGPDLITRLATRGIGVVIVTGDPTTVAARGVAMLAKPFALEVLRTTLDELRGTP